MVRQNAIATDADEAEANNTDATKRASPEETGTKTTNTR